MSLRKVQESIENSITRKISIPSESDGCVIEALGSITGETIGEDLVNEIFSKFCMGK